MNPLLPPTALLSLALLAACGSSPAPTSPPALSAVAPAAPAAASAPAPRAASSPAQAPAPVPSPGDSSPSLRETQRLQRELGSAVVPYPFDHCAVIMKPFAEKPPLHRRIYQGHEVLFCCTPCVRAFDTNPDPYMPRIVAAAAAKASGSQP